MSYVFSRTASGLTTAFNASDEASVARALKEFDRDLRLDWYIDPGWDRQVWRVRRFIASDWPAVWICDWRGDDMEPLPLSHGLVEQVKRLHMDSRAPRRDAEAENDRRRDQIEQEAQEETDWYAAELVKRIRGKGGTVLPRGVYRRNTRFKDIRR